MTAAGTRGFEEFRHQQYTPLLRWLAARGASFPDAEDAAQMAFTEVWRRWAALASPGGYLHRVAANELVRLWKARLWHDTALHGSACEASRQAPGDFPGRLQAAVVRQHLLALPPRQREAMAGCYDGYRDGELAAALDASLATIRSNRRHARAALRPFINADRPDLPGRVLRQAYAEMRGGNLSPAGSRPVISQSWTRSARLRVDPAHGALTDPLSPDELAFRRGTSLLAAACPAACTRLARSAAATGLMVVVVDAQGWVLWRAGDRNALRRADHDGHSDGACLAEHTVGTSGVSVALAASHPVLVRGPEHYMDALHDLTCAAAPIHHPRDGRLLGALNLTAPWHAAHPAMLKLIDETARQIERHIGQHHGNHLHDL